MAHLYVTHPEVIIDPAVVMPRWGLSNEGIRRAEMFAARDVLPKNATIFSSPERKATQLAEILAKQLNAPLLISDDMGENDRSSTGYLAQVEFEQTAAQFFANPAIGPRGWESALPAQRRIVDAVDTAARSANSPIVFCGHGAVGTLLKCWLGDRPISLAEDQRVIAWRGGGNAFWFDLPPRALHTDWQSMEVLEAHV